MKVKPIRDQLFEDANSMTADAFIAKYVPYTMKVRMKNTSRYLLWKLRVQNMVRHIKHMIIHRK